MRVLPAALLSSTAVLFPMSTASPQGRAQAAPPPVLATVTVDPTSLGTLIPADFVGFSLEVSTAGQGIGAFQGPGQQPRAGASAEDIVYALGRSMVPSDEPEVTSIAPNIGASSVSTTSSPVVTSTICSSRWKNRSRTTRVRPSTVMMKKMSHAC